MQSIIEDNIFGSVNRFMKQSSGARILLKKVPDPERFGVAEFQGKKITRIIEKPANPKTPYAVVGVYMYDEQVFKIVRTLKPSRSTASKVPLPNSIFLTFS